jgi:hypothetical protein
MRKLIAVLLVMAFAGPAFARCDYSWQTAKDGSNCGDRAADRRAGGPLTTAGHSAR